MFSSEDFISARKLGCLNSQVCERLKRKVSSSKVSAKPETHVLSVRATSLLGVLDFVEVVLVELTDERGKVGVLEVEREDRASERVHVLFRERGSERANRGKWASRKLTLTTKESPE